MPLLIAGAAGIAVGLVMSKGTEDIAGAAKWIVAGGVVYVGARALKVI